MNDMVEHPSVMIGKERLQEVVKEFIEHCTIEELAKVGQMLDATIMPERHGRSVTVTPHFQCRGLFDEDFRHVHARYYVPMQCTMPACVNYHHKFLENRYVFHSHILKCTGCGATMEEAWMSQTIQVRSVSRVVLVHVCSSDVRLFWKKDEVNSRFYIRRPIQGGQFEEKPFDLSLYGERVLRRVLLAHAKALYTYVYRRYGASGGLSRMVRCNVEEL